MRFNPMSPWGKACRAVRARTPTENELNGLGGGRVLSAAEPTVDDMHIFHDLYPQGLFVCITIWEAQRLNDLAVQALLTPDLHAGEMVIESNGDTRRVPIHSSARLMVTRNMNKDLVDGAFGHVVHFARDCVVLRPDSGLEAATNRVASETDDGQYFVAYLRELEFDCALAKVQGYTMDKGVAVFRDGGKGPRSGDAASQRLQTVLAHDPNERVLHPGLDGLGCEASSLSDHNSNQARFKKARAPTVGGRPCLVNDIWETYFLLSQPRKNQRIV